MKPNDSNTMYTLHTNYIGSIEKISDTYGHIVDSMSYTPFGLRRSVTDWTRNDTATRFTDRGFTGQQHLDNFALINFNGRMYDPVLAHFLSPDPYIQAPENPLNYNRYAYCLYSPLQYVDPSGEKIEYNSFIDRLIVGLQKNFNRNFMKQFQELKKSDEIYVFKRNKEGDNSFTTDGNKLYINYSIDDNDNSKKEGQTIFTYLRHEATHGIQFEYGELGFVYNQQDNYWMPINYDIMDEYEAHNNQNYGFRWNTIDKSIRDIWIRKSTTTENKINA